MKKSILILISSLLLLSININAQVEIRKSSVWKMDLGYGFTSLIAQGYYPFDETDTTRYVSKEEYSEFSDSKDFCQTVMDPNESIYLWDNLPSRISGTTKKKGKIYLFGSTYKGKRIFYIYQWTGECIQPIFEIWGVPIGAGINEIKKISKNKIVLDMHFPFLRKSKIIAKPLNKDVWEVINK